MSRDVTGLSVHTLAGRIYAVSYRNHLRAMSRKCITSTEGSDSSAKKGTIQILDCPILSQLSTTKRCRRSMKKQGCFLLDKSEHYDRRKGHAPARVRLSNRFSTHVPIQCKLNFYSYCYQHAEPAAKLWSRHHTTPHERTLLSRGTTSNHPTEKHHQITARILPTGGDQRLLLLLLLC